MLSDELYKQIFSQITRKAQSVEEVEQLINRLSQEDWQQSINLDRQTKRRHCANCNTRLPAKDLSPLPEDTSINRYCSKCITFCPICTGYHPRKRYQWMYPLCEKCLNQIDRQKIDQEQRRVKIQNTRAESQQLPASLTVGEWIATLEHFSWKCAYCLIAPYQHFEHFLPLVHKGGTTWSNCVPSCKRCNFLKSQYHPDKIIGIPPDAIQRVRDYLSQH